MTLQKATGRRRLGWCVSHKDHALFKCCQITKGSTKNKLYLQC